MCAIIRVLKKRYPGVSTALRHKNPLELLVATILSAQCTDARVNLVTKTLFKKYRTLRDYAHARRCDFERTIRSTGFYHAKAKNIIAAAQMIERDFNGRVPDSMEELVQLPGVARKTANIVLTHGFGKVEGIAVDTHVRRVSFRLGLTCHQDPVKIEQDLMRITPRKAWGLMSDLLIAHGRATCVAAKPRCLACVLASRCPSKKLFYGNKSSVYTSNSQKAR